MTHTRSRSRSAARLAAVQALYQQEMEGTALPKLLHEFHQHRIGETIDWLARVDAAGFRARDVGKVVLDIAGDSYRLRDHHARTDKLRAGTRPGTLS